jgi:hypothetical protein
MSWWKMLFGIESKPCPGPAVPNLSSSDDHLYPEAAAFVMSTGRCSISALQRHLKIGYQRAAQLMDSLENDSVVSSLAVDGTRFLLSDAQRQQSRLMPSRAELLGQQQAEERAQRYSYLFGKYQDTEITERIMAGKIWEGMTAAQLFDAAGEPEAVDQKYLKRFSRETWKYDGESGNRYRTRVTLENGIVVGWDIKS